MIGALSAITLDRSHGASGLRMLWSCAHKPGWRSAMPIGSARMAACEPVARGAGA